MSDQALRLRRLVVLGAIAGGFVAALAFAAFNVVEATATAALAEQQEGFVTNLERRLAGLSPASAASDMTAIYLPGDGPELARARLQDFLAGAVKAAEGRLIETQEPGGAPAEEGGDDGRVDLRVTFDARNEQLLNILYAVETGLPLLTVDRFEAHRLDGAADGDQEDPTLRVSFVARGYRKIVR